MRQALLLLPLIFFFACNPTPKISVLTDGQQAQLKSCGQAVSEGRFKDAMTEIVSLFDTERCRTPETYFYRGFIWDKAEGDEKKALSCYQIALAQLKTTKDSASDFLESMIDFYAAYSSTRLGRQDDTIQFMNASLDILERLEKTGRLDQGAGNYFLAYCYSRKGQDDLSLEHYKAAIKYFNDNKIVSYLKAGAMFNTGLYYYNKADYIKAQEWWQKAYDSEPDWGYFKNEYDKWLATVKEKNTSSGQ